MDSRRQALGGFKLMKDPELLSAAHAILKAMTGNANFPDPIIPLNVLEDAVKEYEKYLTQVAHTQSKQSIAARNEAKLTVMSMLKKMAFYVNDAAGGHLEKLYSSGFSISQGVSRRQFPEIVAEVRLRDGRGIGSMKLDFKKQENIPLYEYRYASKKDETGAIIEWCEPLLTSSTRVTINELNPMTIYYVQVRALNGEGRSEWSEPVSHAVR